MWPESHANLVRLCKHETNSQWYHTKMEIILDMESVAISVYQYIMSTKSFPKKTTSIVYTLYRGAYYTGCLQNIKGRKGLPCPDTQGHI